MSKNIIFKAQVIKQTILDDYKVDITSDCRKRETVYYRMAFISYLRKNYGISYESLARMINKNHSSCIYFVKQSKYLLDSPYGDYKEIHTIVSRIGKSVNSKIYILPRMYGRKALKTLRIHKPNFPSVSQNS